MKSRYSLKTLAKAAGRSGKPVVLRPVPPSRLAEAAYRKALFTLLREAGAVVRSDVLPAADEARRALATKDTGRLGGAFSILRWMIRRLVAQASTHIERVLRLEGERHTKRFRETVRAALGIDLSAVIAETDLADEMALAVRRNVALIESLGEDVARRVETAVTEAVLQGRPARDLAQTLTAEFGITQRRAKIIARDQTAKLTADLNRLRQVQAGIASYRWSTSRDERVRPTHRANEGRVFRWDTPPPVTGHPGHDVLCRCVPLPILD